MKKNLVKAIILCTLALSFLISGLASVNTTSTYAVARHDGPHDGMIGK